MANSAFVCHKLIDDIIKRGGQQVSDRYIIKKCLSKTVLSSKKFITNQMVKQSGIKSEYCTINQDLMPDQPPINIKKDEYMCKSVQRIHTKSKQKNYDPRKSMSISKMKNNKQSTATTLPGKQSILSAPRTKKPSEPRLIQLEDVKLSNKLNQNQNRKSDQMRIKLLERQEIGKAELDREQQMREKSIANLKKAKNNFQKELNSQGGEHTYHTDGRFMVYSQKNKQKCIANNFPPTMGSTIKGQSFPHKRNQSNPVPSQAKSLPSESKIVDSDTHCDSAAQIKQGIYNNNDQRQTTSLNFLKIKPGICFTQPSSGQSVRGERENSEEFGLVKQKKSTFSKFLTKDLRSKTDGFINFKKEEGKKYSLTAKTQFYEAHDKFQIVFSRRYKTMRSNRADGKITNINQSLLQRLIGRQVL